MNNGMMAWLKTRPESVQKLAAEFPIGTVLWLNDVRYYLLGYTEDDMLIVSYIDPHVNHGLAVSTAKYICASHFRGTVIMTREFHDRKH